MVARSVERAFVGAATTRLDALVRGRAGAFAFAVLLLAVLGGCSSVASRHAGAGGTAGELRFTEGEDIDSLNQLLTTELVSVDIGSLTQGYLFTFDRRDDLVPSLALLVPTRRNGAISRDGRTIVYHLRHGVVWQDGAPFTSADVAFTVKTILDPHVNVASTLGYDDVARVATPDAYTVVVHLKRPYAPFVSLFLTPGTGSVILPKHLLAGQDLNHAAYNNRPVGLGPFEIVRWTRGSSVEMVAFDRWWGGRPKLRRIVYRIIPDADTAINELRTGELDAFGHIPNVQYPAAKAVAHTRTFDVDTTGFEHVDFNLRNPVLADRRVREALVRAIDTREIVRKVDRGSGFLSCSPVPHFSWAYDASTPCYSFDLRASDRLLRAAGWRMGADGLRHKDGRTLRLTLASTVGNLSRDETAILMQSWFRRIGVDLSYRRYQANQFFAHGDGVLDAGTFDLALFSWYWGADPDLSRLFACASIPPHGQNESRYCNPTVDRLLADALAHYGRARRRADYARVQAILAHDLPEVVLYQVRDHLTIADGFHHVAPGPILLFTRPADLCEASAGTCSAKGAR